MNLLESCNQNLEIFQELNLDTPLVLNNVQPWKVAQNTTSVLYLVTRPLVRTKITYGEALVLAFGEMLPLFTLGLNFGFIFNFSKCRVEKDPNYCLLVRQERNKYQHTELLFQHASLLVLGSPDVTLITKREFNLLPAFSAI